MTVPGAGVFRAYGIRGLAGRDLDTDGARAVGLAFAAMVREAGGSEVLVGHDCRRSSPWLAEGLVDGLLGGGCDVLDAGLVATPVLYHGVETLGVDGGVQVTGSHSPVGHNGFKFLLGAESLGEDGLQRIRARLGRRSSAARGRLWRRPITDDYVAGVLSAVDPIATRPRVVVDPGNGTAAGLAARIYGQLGCRVIEIHGSVDPDFPGRGPDPSAGALETLCRRVRESGADLGLAFDGDADRIVLVSAGGRVVDGDALAWVLAADLLPAWKGATFVLDVKCSGSVLEAIRGRGGQPRLCRTGHPYMKQRMRACASPFGAERSGHYYFADRFTGQDDGIYAGARLLEMIARDSACVSRRLGELPQRHASGEIRHPVEPDLKLSLRDAVAAALGERPGACLEDGVRLRYADGWGLVRASHSANHLTILCEGATREALERIREELLAAVVDAERRLVGTGSTTATESGP